VQVPDNAVTITPNTLAISVADVAVVDQFLRFQDGARNNLGTAGIPATVSFNITYTKSGAPRSVQPTSGDPLSPFTWEGEMWMATNSGTFSVAYNDGSFAADGNFSSAGNFGEMGTERNGSFVQDQQARLALPLVGQTASNVLTDHKHDRAMRVALSPSLKGRVPPLQYLIHGAPRF